MALDPNRRCTCGYRRFRDLREAASSAVERWMLFDDHTSGGFGSTPFGTYFGAGTGGTYGKFTSTLRSTTEEVRCENCNRRRSLRTLGGVAVFGSYVAGPFIYVAVSDGVAPYTCFDVRFTGPTRSFTVALKRAAGVPAPIIAPAPAITSPTLPPGEPYVDTLLRARIPEVPDTETYLVTFVDRCAGAETSLASITIEEPPMDIAIDTADLSSFPELWLRQDLSRRTQAASGSVKGIPFDYCEGVLEYDAQFGSLPSAQGWAHQAGVGTGAPGDYALVEGGALQVATPGVANPSYWEKSVTLTAVPTESHGYAGFIWTSDSGAAAGSGLDFQGIYAQNTGPYNGFRFDYRGGQLYRTNLDGSADAAWSESAHDSRGWHDAAAAQNTAPGDGLLVLNGERESSAFVGGVGAAAATELRARFGDESGDGVSALIRNFVVSTPGRFLRARLRGVAPVSDPTLRLYLLRDVLNAGTGATARFLVRVSAGTASPYAIPTSTFATTVNFTTSNSVLEVPFVLSGLGLVAGQPFVFTVERDWANADDTAQATVWLTQATVRSS